MRRVQSINKVYSADEAIDGMGGPRRWGYSSAVDERVVWNWRKRGFPSHRYREIKHLLQRRR